MYRASIAVSKPTPRYYTPGVGLPLHPSTSILVITASARFLPNVYALRLDWMHFSLVAELNSLRREPREI
jgi:hypothetical protein